MKTRKPLSAVLAVFLAATMLASCGAASASAKGGYTEETLWTTNGNKRIWGRMYKPDTGRAYYPTIIMSHGFGSTHRGTQPYAERMAKRGYAVYIYDFCGGGAGSLSDGKMTDMSVLTEASDLEHVYDQISRLPYVDTRHIFLMGESQGGFVSAYVAAKLGYPKVKALVLFYPAFVLQDDARKLFPDGKNIPDTYQAMGGRTVGGIYARDALSFDIYDVIGNYKGDVLIIHGDQDPIVPLSYAQRAQKTYDHAELIVEPGAGHGFYTEPTQTNAANSMGDFLDRHLN